jgi:hypothetical protein
MMQVPNTGDRIRLIAMPADPDPIPSGSLGTVRKVHQHREWAQVEVNWDNGRSLMLTLPDDCIEIIDSQNPES